MEAQVCVCVCVFVHVNMCYARAAHRHGPSLAVQAFFLYAKS